MSENKTSGGFTISGLLFVTGLVLMVLKLLGLIQVSWWWVATPFIVLGIIIGLWIVLAAIFLGIAGGVVVVRNWPFSRRNNWKGPSLMQRLQSVAYPEWLKPKNIWRKITGKEFDNVL